MPPDVPGSITFRFIIDLGFFLLNSPISVANVSPVVTAIAVINPINNKSML